MQGSRIVLGSNQSLPFFLVQSSDHRTPATGLSPVVYVSKNAGAFAKAAGAVTEIANGWYSVAGGAGDVSTIGPLWLDVPAIGPADPVSRRFEVIPASGVCPLVSGSTTYPMTWLMTSSVDHLTGLAGLSPSVSIAKVGGSFGAPAGTVYEFGVGPNGGTHGQGRGLYYVYPNPNDYNTPGPILLRSTATGADETEDAYDCVGTSVVGRINGWILGLLAAKAALVNAGVGFTNGNTVVTLDREPFTNPSPPCCFITPGAFPFDQPYVTGGGRFDAHNQFTFTVTVIVRRAQDIESSDLNWLTDPTRGGYALVFAVVNALMEEFLYDISGDVMTTTGLKTNGPGLPYRYGKDPMMAAVPITFSAGMVLDVVTPDPS